MARLADDVVEPMTAPMGAHVAQCARCAATAARVARLGDALHRVAAPFAQANAPRVFVPPTRAAELSGPAARPRRAWWIGPLAAAAVLAVFAVAERAIRLAHKPAEQPVVAQRDAAPASEQVILAADEQTTPSLDERAELALAATDAGVDSNEDGIEAGLRIGAPGLVWAEDDEWDSTWVDASIRQDAASTGWEYAVPFAPALTVESQWTDEEIELLEPWSDFNENVDESELDLRGDRGVDDDDGIMG